MEKRSVDRIPVNIQIKFLCRNHVYYGTVMNISERGMFINTSEMCLPFDYQVDIFFALEEKTLHVPVNLCRIRMSPDSYDGLGVEVLSPSREYLEFVDNLRLVCKC